MIKEFQRNKGFRIIALVLIAFLIFAETNLVAIGSIHVPVQRITLLTLLLGILVVAAMIKRKAYIDFPILVILLLRIPYYALISFSNLSTRLAFRAHYMIILIAPIVFFTVYSLARVEINKILENLLKISIVIVAIQVHTSLLQLFISGHALYQIKLSIGIPLGYSNTIATVALMQGVLAYILLKNKFYFVISATSLLCTLSKSAFLVFIIVMFVVLLIDSIEKKKLGNFFKYTILIIGILLLASSLFSEYFSVYIKALDSLLSNDLESLSNGRLKIFTGYLNDIAEKPLLGWGLGKYNSINGMAHNLFLQSLFSGGIVGTILYYLPIVIITIKSLRWKRKDCRNALYALLLVVIAHGFVENVFFTLTNEFLFWIYITLIYKEGNTYEKNRLCDTKL